MTILIQVLLALLPYILPLILKRDRSDRVLFKLREKLKERRETRKTKVRRPWFRRLK